MLDVRAPSSASPMNEKVMRGWISVATVAPAFSRSHPVPHSETCSTLNCTSIAPGTANVIAFAGEGAPGASAYCFQMRCTSSRTPVMKPVTWNARPLKPSPSGSVAPGGSSTPLTGSLTPGKGGSEESGGSAVKSAGRKLGSSARAKYQRSSETAHPPATTIELP
jgi:hypothetical protein